MQYPGWFSGWTQTEEQREQMMEDGETSGSMKFVYVWQALMFVVILAYGFIVIRQNRIVTGVTVALVAFTNMCFLCMWLLAGFNNQWWKKFFISIYRSVDFPNDSYGYVYDKK